MTIDVSVVIPVYNAEASIGPLVLGVMDAFGGHGRLQVVLINDASPDRSHEECLHLVMKYPETVTYLRLAKNFGEHNAVMAGLRHAVGAHVVIMDDDFQHRPEDAVRLVQAARAGDYDLVYSSFPEIRQRWTRVLGSRFNGWVANFMLDKPKDLYLSSFKCLSRWLVGEIVRYKGPFPYIDGLALRCTRNIGRVQVLHQVRRQGRSGYTLRKLVGLWLNMFVSFSVIPLRASAVIGFALIIGAVIGMAWVLIETLAGRPVPAGWPFLAIISMLFSGAQLLILGVVGEYLGRLYLTINDTPQAVIRETRGLQS